MNEEQTMSFQKQETYYNLSNDLYLNEDEVSFLEIDIEGLGFFFDSIETIDVEDNVVGVEFSKVFKAPLDIILINSIDNDLLKENLSEIIQDYDIEVNLEVTKRVGKRIKEYSLNISIYKNQQLWEEYFNV